MIGISVALGVLAFGIGTAVVVALGTENAEALRAQAAVGVMRTNQWLDDKNLDKNSSVDMMRALILACDEIKTRGERC